jgi:HEAT repeat protein
MIDDEPKREVTLPAVLKVLGVSDQPLSTRELRVFSGLTRADYALFWPTWQRIDPERRTEIARSMVELAEDTIELDFAELWYWLLDDDAVDVRMAAVDGLWEDLSPRVMRRMLELMRLDPAPGVRADAAMALSRFAYQAVCGDLEHDKDVLRDGLLAVGLDQDQPLEVRRRALESAGYFADSDEVQRQIELAYRSNEQLLRESAIVAMGRSMEPRWLPIIGKELESSSPALRYEAIHAVGELSEDARALVPKLLPLVDDHDSEVALAAIWALGQIGGPVAQRTLERLSRSQDESRREAASDALAELNIDDLKF